MSDQSLCLLISKVCMRLVLLIERIVSPTLQVDVFVLNEILIRVIDGRVALQYQVGGCKTIHYVITVTAIRHVTQH